MKAVNSLIARKVTGGAIIALIIVAFAWFASNFAPGTPRSPKIDTETGSMQAAGTISDMSIHLNADDITDVPFGETFRTEDLTHGKSFAESAETIASWTEEERKARMSAESWLYDLPTLDVTMTGLKALSDEAFIEWYPHYGDARIELSDTEKKVFLVEATVTNPTDKPAAIPMAFALWSEDFNRADGGGGIGCDKYLLEELYGKPQEKYVSYALSDGWNEVAPGETRTFTFPYLVYKNAFRDSAAYEDIDPSHFCLTVTDFDPPTIYRLWLG
ncbi:hypothetical protein [Eggerthella sp. YY7918]|uniref:hypothetical protein n=1 Tax=Eggerthella sp. (strain YY7918) TaxID=502558 RepID=UPI000217169C|nr:hypothetical protein [Eggerthella sp. YY7918]BAK44998.1 hypothetical protein EGYY_18650 [Eggerthella sp. YY7918]